jgi:hypothetical protein
MKVALEAKCGLGLLESHLPVTVCLALVRDGAKTIEADKPLTSNLIQHVFLHGRPTVSQGLVGGNGMLLHIRLAAFWTRNSVWKKKNEACCMP